MRTSGALGRKKIEPKPRGVARREQIPPRGKRVHRPGIKTSFPGPSAFASPFHLPTPVSGLHSQTENSTGRPYDQKS